MENTKSYIGTMLIEDFNRLSYKERDEYIKSLKGVLVESNEDFNIENECTDIDCSIEEYAEQYGYISFQELRERINNIQDKVQTQNAKNQFNS